MAGPAHALQSTPAVPPPSVKKTSSSTGKNQKTLLGFFQKSSVDPSYTVKTASKTINVSPSHGAASKSSLAKHPLRVSSQSLTPAPSSDSLDNLETPPKANPTPNVRDGMTGLPSPRSANGTVHSDGQATVALEFYSPSRKASTYFQRIMHAKKVVSYAESDEEEDKEDSFELAPLNKLRGRVLKRRKTAHISDEEDFGHEIGTEAVMLDHEDFIVPDETDEDLPPSRKRKRPSSTTMQKKLSPIESYSDDDFETVPGSTARQWTFDPENVQPLQPRPVNALSKKPPDPSAKKRKEKACATEPDKRYPWLAAITDIDRNPPGHPDYDSRSVYIPPLAWKNFSPFEKQYWEIKQKLWDTIVFFKKGKFYELYENDATVGHQLFDLKLTDRVNMRMVGVPEMSLDHWANQFVAKGYKIARVDQQETALGKEMRERDGKKPGKAVKEEKIIRRELACILTAGTLVEGGMLQDDMATFCVAIKETEVDGQPAFGIAFVDTATGQFFLTEFIDDEDMTKFETFIAQTRPQELLIERSFASVKMLRILKNNTGPTTIFNYLKSGKEFWAADITRRELDACTYFASKDHDNADAWPITLRDARDKDLLMSAFGALVQYLRVLKIERDLLTLGNFTWYDPIKKATTLVLDGQTLINLEVFANSSDGGLYGTLFSLLNRCITPFGKRLFKQWVCHPLLQANTINARLDAVDSLKADVTICDQFTSQMTKLPDLERLISRTHAGSCKAQDFVRVLDGFEQIDYTIGLLGAGTLGNGVIRQLISAMPDLASALEPWKSAFDHTKAKENGLLVPERGVEEDFDRSQDHIERITCELDELLKKARKDLKSNAICFTNVGKEIYQLEVPTSVKGIPKNWDQMSATVKVKRWYSPELRTLVRRLQEAQEIHGQVVKEVAGRFLARFDEQYELWLAAVRIVAQLDCLIGLAKASSSLGEPCCRPEFVNDERSVIEFEDLRHPCMLPNVTDFIPNDVKLGGDVANIDLLTGANAAGKSTILRMTCVAVIMAQIGCYLPCQSARLTPVDRIMSRLGANDNIFAAQSTFFVELSETKKILSEATPRSLVILDELGRGTSSYDGVAVAQAVLHHIATHIGCVGFFATHYHSLAEEFAKHPEVRNMRMRIHVDEVQRLVTFLYKLEEGVAEGSFGMHCAAMCGIPRKVIERAEVAAKEWEHTSRLKESLEVARMGCWVPLGMQSDVSWLLKEASDEIGERGVDVLKRAIEGL